MANPNGDGSGTLEESLAQTDGKPSSFQLLRERVFGASLVARLNSVVFLCMSFIVVGVIYTTAHLVRSDKVAYVFDLVSRDSITLATGLREALLTHPLTRACLRSETNHPKVVDLSERILPGLSRNPGYGEMFLRVESPGKVTMVCHEAGSVGPATSETKTKARIRSFDAGILASVDGLLGPSTIILNSTGDLIAEPQDFSNEKKEFAEEIFRTYVAGGRKSGTQIIPSASGDQIVSFSEVTGTNIILFTHRPLNQVDETVNAFARALFFVGSGLSALGLVVLSLFLQRFWRPIRQIKLFANALRVGSAPPPFQHSWRDEILDIFNSLTSMSAALQDREAELRAYNVAQTRLVDFSRALALQTSLADLSLRVTEFAPLILHISSEDLLASVEFNERPQSGMRRPGALPELTTQTGELLVPLEEAESIYGQLKIRFKRGTPGELHTTLIIGMARALSSAAHALHLNRQATSAAILQQEISTCEMIQRSIVRLDGAGECYELGSHYIPSSKVGGDWAGVYVDQQGEVAAYVVDVSGHGIDSAFAASVVAGVINTLHAKGTVHPSPDKVVFTLENALTADLHKRVHFTLLIARLNPHEETLTYANLGHLVPLVVSANGNVKKSAPLEAQNSLIGPHQRNATLRTVTVPFRTGDSLLLWTDGLLENPRAIGRRLNTKWLSRQLSEVSHESAAEIADALLARSSEGLEDREAADDICIIVLQARGTGHLLRQKGHPAA